MGGTLALVGHRFELPIAPEVLNAQAVIADLDINNPPLPPLCSSSPKSIDCRGVNALSAAEKHEASSGVVHFNSPRLSCSLRRRRPSPHDKNVQ